MSQAKYNFGEYELFRPSKGFDFRIVHFLFINLTLFTMDKTKKNINMVSWSWTRTQNLNISKYCILLLLLLLGQTPRLCRVFLVMILTCFVWKVSRDFNFFIFYFDNKCFACYAKEANFFLICIDFALSGTLQSSITPISRHWGVIQNLKISASVPAFFSPQDQWPERVQT